MDCLDPNLYADVTPKGYLSKWPTWQEGKQLLELGAEGTWLKDGGERGESYAYFSENLESLRV